jgi:hypothetical protein
LRSANGSTLRRRATANAGARRVNIERRSGVKLGRRLTGLTPNRTLAQQDQRTCLWIRNAFLTADPDDIPADHVVHGHTPHRQPELLPHRTNLDTGVYVTGILTVGIFDDDVPGGPIEVWSIE